MNGILVERCRPHQSMAAVCMAEDGLPRPSATHLGDLHFFEYLAARRPGELQKEICRRRRKDSLTFSPFTASFLSTDV